MFREGFKRYRRSLLLGFVFFLLTVLSGIALLALSGWFITAAALTGLATAAGLFAVLDIFTPGTGIRFFALLRTVARYFERITHHNAVLRVQAWWRTQMFAQLSEREPAHFTRLRTATILQRLTQDLNTLDSWYLRLIAPPLAAALALLAVFTLITIFSVQVMPWLVALCLLVFCSVWALAVPFARARTYRTGRAEVEQSSEFRQSSMDFYEGFAELHAAQRWQAHAMQIAWQGTVLNRLQNKRLRLASILESIVLGALQLLALITLLAGLMAYRDGLMSLPVVVMQALAILALLEVLGPLAEQSTQAGLVAQARHRLLEMQQKPTVLHSSLHLEAFNIPLPQGTVSAVIGASGSGKSSIAQALVGIIQEPNWQFSLADELKCQHQQQWLAQLGYVPQANLVLAGTIATNLQVAAPQAAEAQLWQALEFAALHEEVKAMPEQLHTWVGTGGIAISGGQARRLMLARLYLQDPKLVVLDEPCTGLDNNIRTQVLQNLNEWLANRTALVLGHSLQALPEADAQWCIREHYLSKLSLR